MPALMARCSHLRLDGQLWAAGRGITGAVKSIARHHVLLFCGERVVCVRRRSFLLCNTSAESVDQGGAVVLRVLHYKAHQNDPHLDWITFMY